MDINNISRAYMSEAETRRANGRITNLMSLILNVAPDAIDVSYVKEIATSCGVSEEYAYAELMAAVCGIDSEKEDRSFFKNYFLPMIHKCDRAFFENDPYYKNIKIPEAELGTWKLTNMKLKPCEAFVCNDFLVPPDRRLIPQIGFFTEEFKYPAVLENGREWMTLMPNETVTTLPAVRAANGKVLTFGLGLGYFTYMTSQKENVSSVTVVELSRDVIKLFEEFILPQFPNRDKIKIVCDDAFGFIENSMKNEDFDFVFADFWHDVSDGREHYLRLKEYEKNFPNTKFTYWLEETIKCYLDRDLWP